MSSPSRSSSQSKSMGNYRKQFERLEQEGGARFLTFSCFRRLPFFRNDRIKDRFIHLFAERSERFRLKIFAWVIMPEHVHAVVLPHAEGDVSRWLTSLKGDLAAEVIARWRELDATILAKARDRAGVAHFWQAGGGHDRCVWGRELFEKIGYSHRNPIARGLCATSVDWPWSSARRYESREDAIGPAIAFDGLPPDQWHLPLT